MQITIFSITLIAYIFWEMYNTRNVRKLFIKISGLYIAVRLHIRMGYFMRLGEHYITYNSMLTYVLLFFGALLIIGHKVKRNICIIIFAIFSVGITLISRILFPYSGEIVLGNWQHFVGNITGYASYDHSSYMGHISDNGLMIGYYVNIISIFIFIYIIYNAASENDYMDMASTIIWFCKLQTFVSLIDVVAKNVFSSNIVPKITTMIFGQYEMHHMELSRRGLFYEIVGLTQEASMLTTAFFYSVVLALILWKHYKSLNCDKKANKYRRLAITMGILQMINPSLSSVVYLILLIAIYFLFFSNNKVRNGKVLFRVCFGIIAFIILIGLIESRYKSWESSDSYLFSRIGLSYSQMKTIYSGGSYMIYGSEAIRFSGIFYVFRLISERPLFGMGIGAVTCDSGLITLISNVGIMGTIAWIVCVYKFYSTNLIFRLANKAFLVMLMIIPNLFLNNYDVITMLIVPFEGALLNRLLFSNVRVENEKLDNDRVRVGI